MNDWQLTARGRIGRVLKQDLDKSGRNPKFKYYITMFPDEAPVAEAPDADLGSELTFGVREHDLRRMTPVTPQVGEVWTFVGRASGQRPAHVVLTGLSQPRDSDGGQPT